MGRLWGRLRRPPTPALVEGWLVKRQVAVSESWVRRYCVMHGDAIQVVLVMYSDESCTRILGTLDLAPCAQVFPFREVTEDQGNIIKLLPERDKLLRRRPFGFVLYVGPHELVPIFCFDPVHEARLHMWARAVADVASDLEPAALQRLMDPEKPTMGVKKKIRAAAAVVIQSVQRGRITRRKVGQKRQRILMRAQASSSPDGLATECVFDMNFERRREEEARLLPSVGSRSDFVNVDVVETNKLETVLEDERQVAAATRIQALQRGKTVRMEVDALRQARLVEEQSQEAAAIRIQALQRGNTARIECEAKRQERRNDKSQQPAAATTRLSIQRGSGVENDDDDLQVEEHLRDDDDASDNQPRRLSLDRRLSARERARSSLLYSSQLKNVRKDGDNTMDAPKDKTAPVAHRAATIVIKSAYRGIAARQNTNVEASLKAQSFGTRKAENDARKAAAIKIQSAHRGNAIRQNTRAAAKLGAPTSAAPKPENEATLMEPSCTSKTQVLEAQEAAVIIQSVYRSVAAIKRASDTVSPSAQASGARCSETNASDARKNAVIKIQSAHRGNAVRQNMIANTQAKAMSSNAQTLAVDRPETQERDPSRHDEDETQVAAATRIQAMQRGNVARKKKREQHAAATRIQSVYRGDTVRKLVENDHAAHASHAAHLGQADDGNNMPV